MSGFFLLSALLCCAALAQNAVNDPFASVAGVVTNSITGDPVLRAHVTLRSFGNGGETSFPAVTNVDGKFSIANLPPGAYFATVQRAGFVEAGRPGETDLMLRAGENRTGLDLKLIPTGAITGRVLDAEGNPVESAQVMALNAGGAETDDKGRFRIGGLRPGKYQLRVEVNDLPLPPEVRTDGTVDMHYSPTYYPASLTAAGAAKVEAKPGAETGGIEIRLVATPIVSVSGAVSGFPSDEKNIQLQLQGEAGFRFRNAGIAGNGPFRIWRVDPGKYRLIATAGSFGRQLRTAPVDIEVAGANVENIELRVAPPSNLTGTVQFEDEQPKRPERSAAQPLMIDLRNPSGFNVDSGMNFVEPVEVGPDGSFTLKNIQPDRYRIGLSWEHLYIKSARLGSAEITDGILDLSNGAPGAHLTLVLSAATASISGTVRGEDGPAANAPVVLLFDTSAGGIAGFTRSKADGSYSIEGIAPGKYKLAAVDSDDNAALLGKDLGDYGDGVKAIEIGEREKATVDLSRRRR